MNKKRKNFILVLCGLVIGVINGLFGGGGGMVCVPTLQRVLKKNTKPAHATAIFVMFPISIASMIIYLTGGSFDFGKNIWLILGVLVGGIFGAMLLKKINNKVINIIFALIMLGAGIRMLF